MKHTKRAVLLVLAAFSIAGIAVAWVVFCSGLIGGLWGLLMSIAPIFLGPIIFGIIRDLRA